LKMVSDSNVRSKISMTDQIQVSATQLWSSVKKSGISVGDSNDGQDRGHVSLESVIRVMFGSCTFGNVSTEDEGTKGESHSPSSKGISKSTCEPVSPTRSKEDSLYNKLFSETMRAQEAVSHLRQQLEHRKAQKSPSRSGTSIPGFYPASSPHKAEREIAIPNKISEVQSHKDEKEVAEQSFDDDISCISAQTLEDLAQEYQAENGPFSRVRSEVTQQPAEFPEENWKKTATPNGRGSPRRNRLASLSPLIMARGRSHQSKGSKSFATKSTMSTQTNEFSAAWRKDELKYWNDVVKVDGNNMSSSDGSPSRSDKLRHAQKMLRRGNSKHDGTITTVHSSVSGSQLSPDTAFVGAFEIPVGTEMAEI